MKGFNPSPVKNKKNISDKYISHFAKNSSNIYEYNLMTKLN